MAQSGGRGVFLFGLAVFAAVLVLAVYQVPQPWRGILVGWLLFMATAGILILRLVSHYYQYKSLQLSKQRSTDTVATRPNRKPRRTDADALKVVYSNAAGNGRRIIR